MRFSRTALPIDVQPPTSVLDIDDPEVEQACTSKRPQGLGVPTNNAKYLAEILVEDGIVGVEFDEDNEYDRYTKLDLLQYAKMAGFDVFSHMSLDNGNRDALVIAANFERYVEGGTIADTGVLVKSLEHWLQNTGSVETFAEHWGLSVVDCRRAAATIA